MTDERKLEIMQATADLIAASENLKGLAGEGRTASVLIEIARVISVNSDKGLAVVRSL